MDETVRPDRVKSRVPFMATAVSIDEVFGTDKQDFALEMTYDEEPPQRSRAAMWWLGLVVLGGMLALAWHYFGAQVSSSLQRGLALAPETTSSASNEIAPVAVELGKEALPTLSRQARGVESAKESNAMTTITIPSALPLVPSLTAWQDVDSSFERFCLTAGITAIEQMVCEDAQQLAGGAA